MSDRPRFPLQDEMTGEVVSDPDGHPISELEGHDYLGLSETLSLEERAAGERAWRYGHVIVDEAQDLTPMQWRMVARRARGHSMTIVGDLAQRTVGDPASWPQLLPPEVGEVSRFDLTTNYRSPEPVSELAAQVLDQLPQNLIAPIAIRAGEHDVERVATNDVVGSVADQIKRHGEDFDGQIAVIAVEPSRFVTKDERVRVLSPTAAKGMEFDSVIVVEPSEILTLDHGVGLLYVAITRSTDRLVMLHANPLPSYLRS